MLYLSDQWTKLACVDCYILLYNKGKYKGWKEMYSVGCIVVAESCKFGLSTCCAVGTNSVSLIHETLLYIVCMSKQVGLQHAPALWKCQALHSVPILWNSGTHNLFFHLPPCDTWRCIPTEIFWSVVILDGTFLCSCSCSIVFELDGPFL
jgi:hypothetical protein